MKVINGIFLLFSPTIRNQLLCRMWRAAACLRIWSAGNRSPLPPSHPNPFPPGAREAALSATPMLTPHCSPLRPITIVPRPPPLPPPPLPVKPSTSTAEVSARAVFRLRRCRPPKWRGNRARAPPPPERRTAATTVAATRTRKWTGGWPITPERGWEFKYQN